MESVLRRTGKTGDRYTVGDVCIDARAMRVTRGGEPVLLTPKEFDLLLLFVQNRNIALFRETIYERVWGTNSRVTAARSTCMCSGCGESWAGRESS